MTTKIEHLRDLHSKIKAEPMLGRAFFNKSYDELPALLDLLEQMAEALEMQQPQTPEPMVKLRRAIAAYNDFNEVK